MKIKIEIDPLRFIVGFLVTLLAISCNNETQSEDNKKREVVVYSQCSSEEASSDQLYSVDEIKEQLAENSISVKIDDEMKLCGYLLVNGTKTKKIEGALTDIELLDEVNKFLSRIDIAIDIDWFNGFNIIREDLASQTPRTWLPRPVE